MQTLLNPAEIRATLLGLAAWVGALLLAAGVDLDGFHRVLDGLFDNPMAWETALTLFDVDEIMLALTARPAGLWRAALPGMGSALGAVLAGVVALAVARRLGAVGRPFDEFRSSLAFLLCQERRPVSLHYTSEQFWLRIRGR